ncbi:uncharacterized protein SCODWIG_00814 [Saccharomycodes ludwigii]|uniref:Ras-GAP domain-containing protein n=1 Tax=Saccharomycodes ludwigii TaxID=36035 RepID=A0A376B302_9ASCO|nr:uncharacterized protein SCODWIG_00814 [Saccharomycodes ludwigii]
MKATITTSSSSKNLNIKPSKLNTGYDTGNNSTGLGVVDNKRKLINPLMLREELIKNISSKNGAFKGKVDWCDDYKLLDWKTNVLHIDSKGSLTVCQKPILNPQDKFIIKHLQNVSIKLLHNYYHNSHHNHQHHVSANEVPYSQNMTPIIHITSRNKKQKIFINCKDNKKIFKELFSSLIFWKNLKTCGLLEKINVKSIFTINKSLLECDHQQQQLPMKNDNTLNSTSGTSLLRRKKKNSPPTTKASPRQQQKVKEPTNLIVCQFNIYGPIPLHKNIPRLTNIQHPPYKLYSRTYVTKRRQPLQQHQHQHQQSIQSISSSATNNSMETINTVTINTTHGYSNSSNNQHSNDNSHKSNKDNGGEDYDEGWFQCMGVLKSNGILDFVLQSDGSLIYSVDIKQLLSSEVQILDSSLLGSDSVLYMGILRQLRSNYNLYEGSDNFYLFDSCSKHQHLILQFPLRIDLEDWFVALNTFTNKEVLSLVGTDKSNELKLSNRFKLTLLEADLQGMNFKNALGFYAEISIWGHTWARTSIVSSLTPFWREEFKFDTPVRTKDLKIYIKQQTSQDTAAMSLTDPIVGIVKIDQSLLLNDSLLNETRLPVYTPDHNNFNIGTICVKVLSSINFILPSVNFDKFENILTEIDLTCLTDMVYKSSASNTESILKLEDISMVLLDVLQAIDRQDEWFESLIEAEISRIDVSILKNNNNNQNSSHIINSLFRGNSVLSQTMEKYFNRIGQEYLDNSIGNIIREIVGDGQSCELDPARILLDNTVDDDGDEVDKRREIIIRKNFKKLWYWTSKIWKCIYNSSNDLPPGIKTQLRSFRKRLELIVVQGVTVNEVENIVLNCVSGFLFLRYFCPLLLNPKMFNIIPDHPTENTRRTLTLVTKILLNLSTLTYFGKKEPWMIKMNDFIAEYRDELIDYVDKVTEKKLDFAPKTLKLSSSVARPQILLDPVTRRELPTNPYLIDKYLRETELIKFFAESYFKTTIINRNRKKYVYQSDDYEEASEDLTKNSYSYSNTKGDEGGEIGELAFEDLSENNAEIFGQDLLQLISQVGDVNKKDRRKVKYYLDDSSENLLKQLETESNLLYCKLDHLLSVLSNYEYPIQSILDSPVYAASLVDSLCYEKTTKYVFLDPPNLQTKKNSTRFRYVFENLDAVEKFFGYYVCYGPTSTATGNTGTRGRERSKSAASRTFGSTGTTSTSAESVISAFGPSTKKTNSITSSKISRKLTRLFKK